MFLYVILTAVKRHRKYIKHIKDDKNVSPDIIYVIWAVVVIKSSMYRMTVSLYG